MARDATCGKVTGMAKADSTQDETVEEILASIRQAISADDMRRAAEAASASPPKNAEPAEPAPKPADRSQMHDVIELAIEQALDSVGVGDGAQPAASAPRMLAAQPRPAAVPRPQSEPRLGRELPRPAAGQRPSLLSPRANAAVAMSFDDLQRAMSGGAGRGLDQAVEDVLRPMLRAWLDDNLPALVERLVREEIERVSRGHR
jgi:cell pole-organizing protein PopZ